MRVFLASIISLIILSRFTNSVFAVTTTITNYPGTITSEPFTVNVTISSGATTATNYLRIDLYKEGTNNYFGETFNGNSFYGDSVYDQYFLINMVSTGWSGQISAKVGTTTPTEYSGSGDYLLRVRRYTSANSYTVSEPVSIHIDSASPTQNSSPTQEVSSPTASTNTGNVYLSEAYIYPTSDESEWVEIYNDGSQTATLSNWFLDDEENGGSSPKSFSLNIGAKSFATVILSSSMFNNDGDTVRLLDEQKNLKDSFSYGSGQSALSFGRVSLPSGSICLQSPTKDSANSSCIVPTSKPTSTSTTSSTSSKTSSPTTAPSTSKTTTVKPTASKLVTSAVGSALTSATASPLVLGESTENKNPSPPVASPTKSPKPNRSLFVVEIFSLFAIALALANIIYLGNKKNWWPKLIAMFSDN